MMNRQHTALAFAASSALVAGSMLVRDSVHHGSHFSVITDAVIAISFVSIATKFSLLPDADMMGTKSWYVMPVQSRLMYGLGFRKHRGSSHSVWLAVLVGLIWTLLSSIAVPVHVFPHYTGYFDDVLSGRSLTVGNCIAAYLITSCVTFTMKMRHHAIKTGGYLVLMVLFMLASMSGHLPWWLIGSAVASGMILHGVGDGLTLEKWKPLAPLSFGLNVPISGKTGGDREVHVIGPILRISGLLTSVLLALVVLGPTLLNSQLAGAH